MNLINIDNNIITLIIIFFFFSFYVSESSSLQTDTRVAVDGLKSLRIHCFNESCSGNALSFITKYSNSSKLEFQLPYPLLSVI